MSTQKISKDFHWIFKDVSQAYTIIIFAGIIQNEFSVKPFTGGEVYARAKELYPGIEHIRNTHQIMRYFIRSVFNQSFVIILRKDDNGKHIYSYNPLWVGMTKEKKEVNKFSKKTKKPKVKKASK